MPTHPPARTPAAEFVAAVRADLLRHGDLDRAAAQQAYLKSSMPCHGISSPELGRLLGPHLAGFVPHDRAEWEAVVLALWDGATHREQRYAAIAVAQHALAAQWLDPDALPLLRHLVTSGAWWDLVDGIAGHLVGAVLAQHRAAATPVMLGWAGDADLWVRRTAVLSQLRHKGDTDTHLLHEVIEANVADTSFWLRKAIGWALREYARTDPDWVRAEVDLLGERLSGLSRREATKHL